MTSAIEIPRAFALAALAAVSALAPAVSSAGADGGGEAGLAFHAIQFHAGAGTKGPQASGEGVAGVEYRRDFEKGSAGYISAQTVFKNLRLGDNEYDYSVVVGLYTFKGQLISAHERSIVVPPDWKYTWTSQSFGWPESGKWDVGTYRVKVWLEGEKVGEAAFYIHDGEAAIEPGIDELEIESLAFYEGGDFFRPGITKRPGTSFARSRARRIYWVVRARNRLHNVRAQRPNIVGYYYRPDGSLMAAAASTSVVAPEVEEVVLVEGVGWQAAGNWEPGRYRFELEQDNRVIAERHFVVTDPLTKPRTRPRVVHYGLLDAGVYPAGDGGEAAAAPGGARREYLEVFDPGDTGDLWAEIVVVNNPNYTTEHSHKVAWEWVGPGGGTLAESAGDFTIQPSWKTASRRHSFAPAPPGTPWDEGHYKVRVSVDGRLLTVLRFTIKGAGAAPRG